MAFSGDTFTHLFDWEKDPQRQEKIINARLEAEFDGIDTGLSTLAADITTVEGNVRTKLSAARTYYVRTDGSDSNTGLVDSAGGAFLTIQKPIDVIASTLDIGGQVVTIQVRDGTYTGTVRPKNVVGFGAAGDLIIQGNSGTPANVVISTTSADAVKVDGVTSIWTIKDLKIQTTTTGNCLQSDNNSVLRFGNIDFGACAQSHLLARFGGVIVFTSAYAITAGASTAHVSVASGGTVNTQGADVTLTGTPAFGKYVDATQAGIYAAAVMTFTGGATGTRYSVTGNSAVNTNGGGATYFPGDAAGSTATGGQYT